MKYQNVIFIDYDPAGPFNVVRGLSMAKMMEADLIVIKRRTAYKATGLFIEKFVVEKDRYTWPRRILTREALCNIMEQSQRVIVVDSKGDLSEQAK